jgi:TPR repeat protein
MKLRSEIIAGVGIILLSLTASGEPEAFHSGEQPVVVKQHTSLEEKTKYEALVKYAAEGNVEIQYILGSALFYGLEGVDEDKREAFFWWKKAAEQGHPAAQNELGVMYQKGNVIPQDYAKAACCYRLAAEQGVVLSQDNLGVLLRDGKGVERNEKEAVVWFTKAAYGNYAEAQNHLAYMYANGKGVETNLVEAMAWWSVASSGENETADLGLRQLTPLLTPAQITDAKQRADQIMNVIEKSGEPPLSHFE